VFADAAQAHPRGPPTQGHSTAQAADAVAHAVWEARAGQTRCMLAPTSAPMGVVTDMMPTSAPTYLLSKLAPT
jgi:hypothetical protein